MWWNRVWNQGVISHSLIIQACDRPHLVLPSFVYMYGGTMWYKHRYTCAYRYEYGCIPSHEEDYVNMRSLCLQLSILVQDYTVTLSEKSTSHIFSRPSFTLSRSPTRPSSKSFFKPPPSLLRPPLFRPRKSSFQGLAVKKIHLKIEDIALRARVEKSIGWISDAYIELIGAQQNRRRFLALWYDFSREQSFYIFGGEQ